MDFPNQYNKRELQPPVCSCSGDPKVIKYSSKADANGHLDVYPDGVDYDMQEYIDSWKDSVDINLLVARFQRGEENALDRIRGTYGDFMDMPKDLADYYNRMEKGREFFMTLDPELREMFNQNPLEFFAQYGSTDWLEKIKKFDENHQPISQTPISKSDAVPEDIK